MGNSGKEDFDPQNSLFLDKEFDELRSILSSIKQRYGLSSEEILDIVEQEIEIPLSVFDNDELSPFETVVKYMVEHLGMKYSQIAKELQRDDRTIWATYDKAKKKFLGRLSVKPGDSVPIEHFKDRNFSVSEILVGFMKDDLGYRYSQIARVLHRNDRTVWTVYNRLQKKREVVS